MVKELPNYKYLMEFKLKFLGDTSCIASNIVFIVDLNKSVGQNQDFCQQLKNDKK